MLMCFSVENKSLRLFTAVSGRGAELNGQRLEISEGKRDVWFRSM